MADESWEIVAAEFDRLRKVQPGWNLERYHVRTSSGMDRMRRLRIADAHSVEVSLDVWLDRFMTVGGRKPTERIPRAREIQIEERAEKGLGPDAFSYAWRTANSWRLLFLGVSPASWWPIDFRISAKDDGHAVHFVLEAQMLLNFYRSEETYGLEAQGRMRPVSAALMGEAA